MRRLNSSFSAFEEEPFDALVAEALDHRLSVSCAVTRIKISMTVEEPIDAAKGPDVSRTLDTRRLYAEPLLLDPFSPYPLRRIRVSTPCYRNVTVATASNQSTTSRAATYPLPIHQEASLAPPTAAARTLRGMPQAVSSIA